MTATVAQAEQPAVSATKVVQVTNIAPQATKDQMQTLFGFLGKIEDIRLYPTIRDVSVPVQSRICYIKFFDPACVGVSQHMTNTVFIDRALIVTPFQSSTNEIPDEYRALEIAAQANIVPGLYGNNSKLPPHVTNQIEGVVPNQVITTHDPMLISNGLPPYPPLPINYDSVKIEEIRRTLFVGNIDESVTAQQLIDFFGQAGDVKYTRFCVKENDEKERFALIEFSEQSSIISALKLNGKPLANNPVQVTHSTMSIEKPQAKSNEAAQREIEEAMTRVKEAQNLISAAIDPVIGILSKDKKRRTRSRSRRRTRSRSRGRRRRSRSRRRRSRSRRRTRSRSRRRSRSRSRKRSTSRGRRKRSRDKKRSRSRSRSRTRRKSRSRSRSKRRDRSKSKSKKIRDKKEDKKKDSKEKSVSKDIEVDNEKTKEDDVKKDKARGASRRSRSNSRKPRKSRSRSKRRSRSRGRRSRSRERRKSPRRSPKKRRRSISRSTSKSPRSP